MNQFDTLVNECLTEGFGFGKGFATGAGIGLAAMAPFLGGKFSDKEVPKKPEQVMQAQADKQKDKQEDKQKDKQEVRQTRSVPRTATRGVRNNNPGNIEATGNWRAWGGAQDQDGRFIIFNSPEMGIRAIGKILNTYNDKYKLDTIEKIINRWAPPNENDTRRYVRNVSNWTGIAKDKTLDLDDDETMFKLLNAVIRQENSYTYDPEIVRRAIPLIDREY